MLLFRQFFAGLPTGPVEAARIGGAGWFREFFSVIAPLSGPVIATYAGRIVGWQA